MPELRVEILDPYLKLDHASGNWVFEKELIYVGSFVKKTPDESMSFKVDEPLIDHWVATHNLFVQRGIEVPLPKDHSMDVESNRGKVLSMHKKKDSKGRVALFSIIQFKDQEASKLADTAKVSIFSPLTFTDQNSNTYERPIRHVALTDYPVINSLDGFIAASYFKKGDFVMGLKRIGRALGLDEHEVESVDDERLEEMIEVKIKEMTASLAEHTPAPDDGPATTTTPAPVPDEGASNIPVPVNAAMIQMLAENRTQKIEQLVLDGKITPAVCKDLINNFCKKEVLTLALSSNADDGFAPMLTALSKNDPVILGEQSGGQTNRTVLQLAESENPLIQDAEKRRKAALGA